MKQILLMLMIFSFIVRATEPDRPASIRNPEARQKYIEFRKALDNLSPQETYDRAKQLAEEYPDEITLVTTAASMLGDLSQTKPEPEQTKMREQAVKLLEPLTHHKFEDPAGYARQQVMNEYYYHSQQYKKQYELGLEFNKYKKGLGDFAIGVGGAEYARQLFRRGKMDEARKFAQLARAAWERNDPPNVLRENPFYITALALMGDKERASLYFEENYKKTLYFKESACCWDRDPAHLH